MHPEARDILVEYYREQRALISQQIADLHVIYFEFLDKELNLPPIEALLYEENEVK